jgi:acetyl esterase
MPTIFRFFLKLLLALPDSWKIKLTGGKQIVIQGKELDLKTQVICWINRTFPNIENFKPSTSRKLFNSSSQILSYKSLFIPKVETTVIGDIHNAFKIRIYNPDPNRDKHPILVYLHGGGHVIGNINSYDSICRSLSYYTPCLVFSIDYRLAPEFPFPSPLEDSLRAYLWIRNNAIRLGGDPDRIAIAGDSAGGNLAIATAIRLKEINEYLPNFLGLIYPMTDVSTEHPSYETFQDGFILTRNLMRWFINHHTTNTSDRKNPLASPLLYPDFEGFPNTYISTAGFDPLSDEGKALAYKLGKSKVKVVHSDFPNLIHGYINMIDLLPSAWEAFQDFLKFLKTEWSDHLKTDSLDNDTIE